MNEAIRTAAERHPEMRVVDWNVYSRSHPDWFQPDGIHLTAAGVRYAARVVARGGREPYRWSFRAVPAGLHASATGQLAGSPRGRAGIYGITASVVDSLGERATRRIEIRVRGS